MVAKKKQETKRLGGDSTQKGKEAAESTPPPAAFIPEGIDLGVSSGIAQGEHIEMQDQALPWLKVVQKMSPELDHEDEWPDIECGDLFIPTGETWKADEGLIFVPFYYARTYVEWGANRGGFVEDHGLVKGRELSKTCTKAPNKKVATVLPNENDLVETAYWAGFIVKPDGSDPEQAIFAMTSTFLGASKAWNSKVMKYRLGGSSNYIRHARPWSITTERQDDNKNVWWTPKIMLFNPEEHEGVFHTFDLGGGVELWQECDRLALEFQEGFRLQAPEGEETGGDDAKPVQNEGVKTDGSEPY